MSLREDLPNKRTRAKISVTRASIRIKFANTFYYIDYSVL